MNAYDNNLFSKAQTSLAWMFDYAVTTYGLALNDFYSSFLNSVFCKRFESGDSHVIAGMSGAEIAMRIINEGNPNAELVSPVYSINRSSEYWLGWSLAYYQWIQNIPFKKITENISINEIANMYPKYHEMDIKQFADALDVKRQEAAQFSSLKRLRRLAGYSQLELSEITGIPLRSLQSYEQRQKNINNASVDCVCRLAKALNCNIEMLLET